MRKKRPKERVIGHVLKKVIIWRKFYNGYLDSSGKRLQLSLDEAAKRVGISKKSLDDYLL